VTEVTLYRITRPHYGEEASREKAAANNTPNSRSFDRRLGREEPCKLLPGSEPRQETGVRQNRNRMSLEEPLPMLSPNSLSVSKSSKAMARRPSRVWTLFVTTSYARSRFSYVAPPASGTCPVIGPRSRGAPCSRCVPDSRISREDKLARAQRSLFEILRVGREDLPACHFFPNN
jgi:hypothetical protein